MASTEITPLYYARETILTTEQLAKWLQVSPQFVEGSALPRLQGLGRLVRYSAGTVLDYLEGRAA